jgi:adenine-specific DNA-methyltransferase
MMDNGRDNRAFNKDALEVEGHYALVYIDPPYISQRGVGVDYHHFYHFLEGVTRYEEWPTLIDSRSKHRRLRSVYNPWVDSSAISDVFQCLFERFCDSILVVSYRADGIPAVPDLVRMMRRVKKRVDVYTLEGHQYVLSTRRTAEVLIVGE